MDSKNLAPQKEPFFPNFFYRTQFREKETGIPSSLNLSSKVALISGANAGLGFESAKQLLASKLSHLILAVRSIEKGEAAAVSLRKVNPKAKVEVWELDMCSYTSIQAFADRVGRELIRLDIALLNAGLVKSSFELVQETGHEESMQVNYLSTVLLALLLFPHIRTKKAPGLQPGHLTIVNSGLALTGKLPLDPKKPMQSILKSFDEQKMFDSTTWYNTSKTLMHFFLWKLVDYVYADDVIVNIVDPGFVKGTESMRKMPRITGLMARGFAAMTGRSVELGASTYVDAVAVKGKESHGCFLTSWKIYPFAPLLYTPEGKQLIERLWEETVTELDFVKPLAILNEMRVESI